MHNSSKTVAAVLCFMFYCRCKLLTDDGEDCHRSNLLASSSLSVL